MRLYSPELMGFMRVVENMPCLVCDTETTALKDGEIVQIALCKLDGTELLKTFVKPVHPIPTDATRIHGIENDMVSDAPPWSVVRNIFTAAIQGYEVIIYNAQYDLQMMRSSDAISGLRRIQYEEISSFHCAMLAYAELYGEWNDYRDSFKWQKLSDAARQCRVKVDSAHDAMGDCIMTAGVIQAMLPVFKSSPRNPNSGEK